MKIEIGQYYKLRNGKIVGPMSRDPADDEYPWTANGKCWAEHGHYYSYGPDKDDSDIVALHKASRTTSGMRIDPFDPFDRNLVREGSLGEAAATVRVSPTGGVKASIGKRPLHLLPRDALEAVADALEHGAAKYGDRNWEKGLSISDLVRGADGHLWDWYLRRDDGKDAGPGGSGLSHLAHAACCILFLLSHELRGLPDDRPAPVPAVPRPKQEG